MLETVSTYDSVDEERELLIDDSSGTRFYTYFDNTKNLIQIRKCSQSYCMFLSCCGLCGFVADVVTVVPKCMANNLKLCFTW